MYWDKETQSVIARSGRKQEIIQYSFFDLGKCISNPGLPPIPNTNALLSYLEPCYTDDPNNAAQIFYMVKRKFRYLLYISESAYDCFTIKKSNGKDTNAARCRNAARRFCGHTGCWPVIILRMVWSVCSMPSLARVPMLAMVLSTPAATMPSPCWNSR